ncbi:MAG: hypothetical protein M1814_001962 [Vezdaea aestivalis]|nr:MAG: hypothetical protein M1814_001962 [Vezdaea aestivalis]
MPHKTPPRPSHPKPCKITTPDGWTHVTRGPPALAASPLSSKRTPSTPAPSTSLEYLLVRHASLLSAFPSTPAGRGLSDLLVAQIPSDIERVVVMGLGSVSGSRGPTSLKQLVAVQSVVVALGVEAVEIVVQDPVFNPLDEEVLNALRVKVVRDPEAQALLDSRTMLVAPHCERREFLAWVERWREGWILGNDLREGGDGGTEEKAFLEGRKVWAWTGCEDEIDAFGGMVLYSPSDWRREELKQEIS